MLFSEFVYAFLGYVIDSSLLDDNTISKLTFLRQGAEDREQCAWPGVLDWAVTIVDKINDKTVSWDSERQIAMARLVISRSVENALTLSSVPCPEYNQAQCSYKATHIEGRFKLAHVCSYCFVNGTEHPHTERSCHRKKSYGSSNQASTRQDYRGNHSRSYDHKFDNRYDSKN